MPVSRFRAQLVNSDVKEVTNDAIRRNKITRLTLRVTAGGIETVRGDGSELEIRPGAEELES